MRSGQPRESQCTARGVPVLQIASSVAIPVDNGSLAGGGRDGAAVLGPVGQVRCFRVKRDVAHADCILFGGHTMSPLAGGYDDYSGVTPARRPPTSLQRGQTT